MQASRFVRELFKNPRTISAIVPPAPAEGPGGRLPHGGVCCMVQHWNVCMIVFWRVVWYRAGTFLCMRSWPCMSWPRRALDVVPVVAVAVTWRRGFSSPSCGCDTPMNASASNGFDGVSLSRFAQQICCVYSESHQANDNERNGDEETTTKATTARTVTRSPR